MTDTWMLYYALTIFLMAGCGFMCYYTGRREGVIRFVSYLEENCDKKGVVKIFIDDTSFQILKGD